MFSTCYSFLALFLSVDLQLAQLNSTSYSMLQLAMQYCKIVYMQEHPV